MYNNKYNVKKVDRAPMLSRLRSKVGEYENLFNALIMYANNLKDDGLDIFENQVDDLCLKGKAPIMNKKLAGKMLEGIKPDAYMLVRNGNLIIDFSYHYLLRVVHEKYGKVIDVIMLEKNELAAIKRISVLEKVVVIDEDKHTQLLLSSDGFNLSNVAACIVTCFDVKDEKVQRVFYRIKDLIAAGSSYGGTSFKADGEGSPATRHKNFMMIRKTAIRMYVRENFPDLREMDDVDYPDDEDDVEYVSSKSSAQYVEPKEDADSDKVIEFKQNIDNASTLEDLEIIAKEIKTAGLNQREKVILGGIYKVKKESFSKGTDNVQDS